MKNISHRRVYTSSCIAFFIMNACLYRAAPAASPFDPVQDDPVLPRVLLIGDSISIGYTLPVRQLLEGKANVHRIPVNGQYSSHGIEHIREWLGDEKWDVIHFNWGIWDTHLLDSEGRILLTAKDEREKQGTIRTSIEDYQANLNKLIDVMKPAAGKLIWATTTPMTCRIGKRADDIDLYNAAALKVMRSRSILIDDLNTAIAPHLEEMQAADGCHFKSDGYAYLGAKVANSILAALSMPTSQPTTWTADQTEELTLEGRRVFRFEHECLEQWGYTGGSKQYFYVIESKTKRGPLMVCLHSAGGYGDNFQNGKIELPRNAKIVADSGDEFTGLMLNSGIDSDWWWGRDAIISNPEKYKETLTPVERRVLATVEWVVRKYDIDRNRIYLRGISMGGSGTLGIGLSHGDVFAALRAGVPAGTEHALHRLSHSDSLRDVPPVVVYFSQKDPWSRGMEEWLAFAHTNKLSVLAAWGPWGHLNHYEMTNPAVYEFPWLSIRKNQAYPSFTNASSDKKYSGFQSDASDQNGQMNAYFRWAVQEDQRDRFVIELRLVQSRELDGSVDVPAEVITDVTLRRLQRFSIETGKRYKWMIKREGRIVSSGRITPDDQRLLTIPRVKITPRKASLVIDSE